MATFCVRLIALAKSVQGRSLLKNEVQLGPVIYFEELAQVVNTNPTPETLLAIGSRHDREVVGPPMTS